MISTYNLPDLDLFFSEVSVRKVRVPTEAIRNKQTVKIKGCLVRWVVRRGENHISMASLTQKYLGVLKQKYTYRMTTGFGNH